MRMPRPFSIAGLLLVLLAAACKDLDTVNDNHPDRQSVLSTGSDLGEVLRGGYARWWRAVHGEHPAIALGVAADAYSMSWANFGAQRMGMEPRTAYNNRITEEPDYQQVVTEPWFGCLSAVSSANDVLAALAEGVSIDQGGPQDESVQAAARLLRGLSWGYLGLIFDQTLLIEENDELTELPVFRDYREAIVAAVEELEAAAGQAQSLGGSFSHRYFNGLVLDAGAFAQLCHSYAARFLAQWPRSPEEQAQVDWAAVLNHAGQGLAFDFAPLADGGPWMSYHQYVFAETGQGPFWARMDQRLVAALDPSQPARYPEVIAKGEPPLASTMAQSADQRLLTDFIFLPQNNFPAERGEWHWSHYKHHRNVTDPSFAGDGSSTGPMPAFLAADNQLLLAEAFLRTSRAKEAIDLINAGSRVQRGGLPPLPLTAAAEDIDRAIRYERAIELLSTAPMGLWLDRRRWAPRLGFEELDALGGLQTGTPAQLPVPAEELRIHGLDPYSFGGPMDPMGTNKVY